MASNITVKPANPGLLIRNPDRGMRHLAQEGEVVPQTDYWIRRLRDGDVVQVAEASKPPPAGSKKSS